MCCRMWGVNVGIAIRIEREPPITLDEWNCAVETTAGVRPCESDRSVVNPKTGEVITVLLRKGDTEIKLDGEWYPCFHWSEG